MSSTSYAHWDSTGKFKIAIAGTSHYREAIQSIALNPPGTRALVFGLAYLELDNQNAHDPNAVQVIVNGQLVGHLPATYAKTYRSFTLGLPNHIRRISCAVAITGGLRTPKRTYEYTVELDIPENLKLHLLKEALSDEVVRGHGYAPLVETSRGIYSAKVWIPTSNSDDIHEHGRIKEWTTDEWETVNYYLLNRQNIGLGHKVYELSKVEHARLFHGRASSASLELDGSRFAILRIAADSP